MVFDVDKEKLKHDSLEGETDATKHSSRKGFVQETVLELIENDSGQIVLRDANDSDDPLLVIDFSSKVHDMLGSDAQYVGHQMVHAAIQAVMQKQVSQWHANVYDEEPEHYS